MQKPTAMSVMDLLWAFFASGKQIAFRPILMVFGQ